MLIDAYQEFENLAKVSKRKARKSYYLVLQTQTLELISTAASIIGISIKDPKEFQKQINIYFEKRKNKTKRFPIEDLIMDENMDEKPIEKIILSCQDFDNLPYENKKRKNYFTCVAKTPLYKSITGQVTEDKKEELEENLEESIHFENIGKNIYEITNTTDDWKNKLEELRKEGRITEEEYKKYMMQIDYLTSYYFSLINGEQGKFEEEIKREIRKKK